MPDDDAKREDPAPAPRPAARQQRADDEAEVVYHGPSDEFVVGDARLTRHGPPVRLPRAAFDDLVARFPEHAFSEVRRD